MAFYTFEQLTSPLTYDQARQTAIALLVSLGFKGAASWQEGSWPLTLGVEVPAAIIADLRGLAIAIASSGFNSSAAGSFLTVFSKSHYDNDRGAAVKTRGTLVLTSLPTAVSNVFGAQELVASDDLGHTYRNTEGATLEPGTAALPLEWEAEVAGSASNVGSGTITTLVTTLAGVSVNNPGSWITRVGAQAESDAKLRLRNSSKWGTRAYGSPAAAYEHWALSADPAITRVYVDDNNPLGPGTVRIWIASDSVVDLTAAGVPQAVEDLIEGVTDNRVRRPIGAVVSCAQAANKDLPVDAIAYVATSWQDTAPAALQAAVEKLYATLPIGGIRTDGASGALPFAALYGAVMRVPGVVNVKFNTPNPLVTSGDRALLPSEIAVLSSYAMDIRFVTS